MVKLKDAESDKETIRRLLAATCRRGIENVLAELERNGFYDAPGSVAHHSNYRGGLAEHSLAVYNCAMKLRRKEPDTFGSLNEDSIVLAAILHDVCKADVYFLEPDGKPYKSLRKFPIGHGEKSVIMLLRLGLELTEDEMLAIRWHMGKHSFPNEQVDEHYKEALKSSAEPLITLIRQSDGIAASSHSPK